MGFRKTAAFASGACIALCASVVQAGILATPTRLVLEGRDRTGEFVLVNRGAETERYRITITERRMGDDGRIVEAEEQLPGERSAREMLRFSPRQVELRPGEPQTIRILARRPGDLPRGEYRSHLLIQQIPDPPPPASAESAGRRLTVNLQPIFGIALPVIVRQGELRAEARWSEVEVDTSNRSEPTLRARLLRRGERSTFGTVTAQWIRPDGSAVVVGEVRGIAVYTPNSSRSLELPLRFPDSLPRRGRIELRYETPETEGSHLIAEHSLGLAGP